MDELRERIKMLLAHFSINQTEFADRIGISKGMMSHVMSPTGRQSSFSEDKINRIIEVFPSVNREWVVEGVGNMLNDQAQHSVAIQPSFDFADSNAEDNNELPLIDDESISIQQSDDNRENESSTSKVDTHRKIHKSDLSNRKPERSNTQSTPNSSNMQVPSSPSKQISRIVIFYTDGSFVEYKPDHIY